MHKAIYRKIHIWYSRLQHLAIVCTRNKNTALLLKMWDLMTIDFFWFFLGNFYSCIYRTCTPVYDPNLCLLKKFNRYMVLSRKKIIVKGSEKIRIAFLNSNYVFYTNVCFVNNILQNNKLHLIIQLESLNVYSNVLTEFLCNHFL